MTQPINDTPNIVNFWPTTNSPPEHPCAQACTRHAAGTQAAPCVGACVVDQEDPEREHAATGNAWDVAAASAPQNPDAFGPLPEVPFIMRAGRWDPHDPSRAIGNESPQQKAIRVGVLTNHWAQEDAAMAATNNVLHAHESDEDRRKRLNREAQTRFRNRKRGESARNMRDPVVIAALAKLDKAKADKATNVDARKEWVRQQMVRMNEELLAYGAEWDAYIASVQREVEQAVLTTRGAQVGEG